VVRNPETGRTRKVSYGQAGTAKSGGDRIKPETIGNIVGNTLIDLRKKVNIRRIERIIQIENPVADMAKTREHGGDL
jgi:hypothetical protein